MKSKPKKFQVFCGSPGETSDIDWQNVCRIADERSDSVDPYLKALASAESKDKGKPSLARLIRELRHFHTLTRDTKEFRDTAAFFWKRASDLALRDPSLRFRIGEREYFNTLLRLARSIGEALERSDETFFERYGALWREMCRDRTGPHFHTQVPRICGIALYLRGKLKRDPLKAEIKKAAKDAGMTIRDGDWPKKFHECGLSDLSSDKSGPRKRSAKRTVHPIRRE